jgi:hypothetical protein
MEKEGKLKKGGGERKQEEERDCD